MEATFRAKTSQHHSPAYPTKSLLSHHLSSPSHTQAQKRARMGGFDGSAIEMVNASECQVSISTPLK